MEQLTLTAPTLDETVELVVERLGDDKTFRTLARRAIREFEYNIRYDIDAYDNSEHYLACSDYVYDKAMSVAAESGVELGDGIDDVILRAFNALTGYDFL